jgi:hypothetical protein
LFIVENPQCGKEGIPKCKDLFVLSFVCFCLLLFLFAFVCLFVLDTRALTFIYWASFVHEIVLYYLPSVRISASPKTPFSAFLSMYGLWLLTEGGGWLTFQ